MTTRVYSKKLTQTVEFMESTVNGNVRVYELGSYSYC